jgi:hypothetical protein
MVTPIFNLEKLVILSTQKQVSFWARSMSLTPPYSTSDEITFFVNLLEVALPTSYKFSIMKTQIEF